MRRLALVLFLAAAPAAAQSPSLESRIATALAAQGFDVSVMERTWLGRLRVVAQSDSHRRELVFDPATGEILDDYLVTLSALAMRTAAMEGSDDRNDGDTDWSSVVRESQAGVAVEIPEPVAPGGG